MITDLLTYVCDLGDETTATLSPAVNGGTSLFIPIPSGWETARLVIGNTIQDYLICPNHVGATFKLEAITEVQPLPPAPNTTATPTLSGPTS